MKRSELLPFVALVFAVVGMTGTAWALEIADYGGYPDGSDTTPALNAALVDACGGSDRTVHFLAGEYAFLTPPAPLCSAIRLVGEGDYATKLTRGYSSADFLVGYGLGIYVRDLAIWTADGTSGGIGLHLIASDATGPGGKHVIENVRVLGGTAELPLGTFARGIYLDGLARSLDPIGIRAVSMRNVLLWSATEWTAVWWNCISCEWYGGGAYQGIGTTQGIAVGGPLGTKSWIEADIDWAHSTVWSGALRTR